MAHCEKGLTYVFEVENKIGKIQIDSFIVLCGLQLQADEPQCRIDSDHFGVGKFLLTGFELAAFALFDLLKALRVHMDQTYVRILFQVLNEKANFRFDQTHPVHVLLFYGRAGNQHDEMPFERKRESIDETNNQYLN